MREDAASFHRGQQDNCYMPREDKSATDLPRPLKGVKNPLRMFLQMLLLGSSARRRLIIAQSNSRHNRAPLLFTKEVNNIP